MATGALVGVSIPDGVTLLYMPEHKDDPKAVETLLPWSEYAKERCTGLIDIETMTHENKPQLPI